jgi:hypothetical protein
MEWDGMDKHSSLVVALSAPKKESFIRLTADVNVTKLFPLSLTTKPSKLEGLSFEYFSSQVLGFESKARTNPIG